MRRYVVAGGILLLAVVGLILAGRLRPGTNQGTDISPISVVISTPSPLPPSREIVVKVSGDSGIVVHLCAGDRVRFVNHRREPIILTASDFSFSSGVLQPGDAFAVFPTLNVTVEVSGLDGVSVRDPYRVEVIICEESSWYP